LDSIELKAIKSHQVKPIFLIFRNPPSSERGFDSLVMLSS